MFSRVPDDRHKRSRGVRQSGEYAAWDAWERLGSCCRTEKDHQGGKRLFWSQWLTETPAASHVQGITFTITADIGRKGLPSTRHRRGKRDRIWRRTGFLGKCRRHGGVRHRRWGLHVGSEAAKYIRNHFILPGHMLDSISLLDDQIQASCTFAFQGRRALGHRIDQRIVVRADHKVLVKVVTPPRHGVDHCEPFPTKDGVVVFCLREHSADEMNPVASVRFVLLQYGADTES